MFSAISNLLIYSSNAKLSCSVSSIFSLEVALIVSDGFKAQFQNDWDVQAQAINCHADVYLKSASLGAYIVTELQADPNNNDIVIQANNGAVITSVT